jgi:hypothetical protein
MQGGGAGAATSSSSWPAPSATTGGALYYSDQGLASLVVNINDIGSRGMFLDLHIVVYVDWYRYRTGKRAAEYPAYLKV